MGLFIFVNSFSQTYYYYSKTEYTYGPYYFDQSVGLIEDVLNYKRKQKELELYKEKMKQKTQEIKDYYTSLENYPSKIIDGWHEVTIVSGDEFIDYRKVLVKGNKISDVVWDNWMPEEITFSGPIKDAKSAIQFKNPTENLQGIIQVYFMNSIADSTSISTEPLTPASITFWTARKKENNISVSVNDQLFGPFGARYEEENAPECGDFQSITVYLKPTVEHYFKSLKTGVYSSNSISKLSSKGTKVMLKNGECRLIQITNKN